MRVMSQIGKIKAHTTSHLLTYPLTLSNKNKKILCSSIGNIFNIDNTNYILTCFHCIKNTQKQTFRCGDIEYDCKINSVSDELELALLTITNTNDIGKDMFTLTDLNCDANVDQSSLYIKTITIKGSKIINLECSFDDFKQSNKNNITSLNLPQLPFITVVLTKNYSDISELSGISGSLLMSDNKVLGIVSGIKNSVVYVIPSYIIMRFLTEIKTTKVFNGLCTLVGKFNNCDFTTPLGLDNHEITYGVFVDDTLNINYNNYGYVTNETVYGNLKKQDIIVKINDISITKTGCIFDSRLNKLIDFKTYIALNYTCGNPIQLHIMRFSKTTNEHKPKKIMIRARPLHSLKYIPITFNNNVFDYNGFIFVELSEDILNIYMDTGIFVGQSIMEYYLEKPYRSDTEYVIALIDIQRKSLNKELLSNITKAGLPLKFIQNKSYSIPYISKLNNKKIKTLAEFKDILLQTPDMDPNIDGTNTIILKVHRSNNIKITIKNQIINEIIIV